MTHRLFHECIVGDAFAFIRTWLLTLSAFSNGAFGGRTANGNDAWKPAAFNAFDRQAIRLVERMRNKAPTTYVRMSVFGKPAQR
jgi:hypothetical protein